MKTTVKSIAILGSWVLLGGSLVFAGYYGVRNMGLGRGSSDYDYARSRENLERIGAALQLYREAYGFLPRSERNNRADAGLPFVLTRLAERPGNPWSLPSDYSTFHAPGIPAETRRGRLSDYECWYLSYERLRLKDTRFEGIWSRRGEELPVLIDSNGVRLAQQSGGSGPYQALVLRLGGRVDLVSFDGKTSLDIVRGL